MRTPAIAPARLQSFFAANPTAKSVTPAILVAWEESVIDAQLDASLEVACANQPIDDKFLAYLESIADTIPCDVDGEPYAF